MKSSALNFNIYSYLTASFLQASSPSQYELINKAYVTEEEIRERPDEVYEAEEEQLITRVQDKIGGLKAEDFKDLDSPDQNVKMHSVFKEGSSSIVLTATTVRPNFLPHALPPTTPNSPRN